MRPKERALYEEARRQKDRTHASGRPGEGVLRRDLGEDIRRSGSGKMVRRSRTTSITLDQSLIDKLRAKGVKRGLGYQTMLKMIVMEHLDEY